jgi:(p)ppGpp synthase/HD superfamily hydrolase
MSIYNETSTADKKGKLTAVTILSKDRAGLVSDIMNVMAESGIDIRSHSAKVFTNDKNAQMSSVSIKIIIDESTDLNKLLHRLHKVRSVVTVTAS